MYLGKAVVDIDRNTLYTIFKCFYMKKFEIRDPPSQNSSTFSKTGKSDFKFDNFNILY